MRHRFGKVNIGHAESAAGIAGITKVLLQMKHGVLVPSLHSTVLNTAIDFTNSPFQVQQDLVDWKRPRLALNGKEREYPRRAGISSFGAGGANAHIVIEEYIPAPAYTPGNNNAIQPVAILLSARQEDRLRQMVQQLLALVRTNVYTDKDLAAMAYTLQVGRESMEERLALEVNSLKELEAKLRLISRESGALKTCGREKQKTIKLSYRWWFRMRIWNKRLTPGAGKRNTNNCCLYGYMGWISIGRNCIQRVTRPNTICNASACLPIHLPETVTGPCL
nr:ketoacyl-synthetase C-terminal extension domain-containing protein [Paraflavitalea speifideiaquila]